jgi:hypothetical protein
MVIFDKTRIGVNDLMLLIANLNGYLPIAIVSDMPAPNFFAVNLRDDEDKDEDDFDDDDDFYNEDDEDKENPFDREPTDKEIRDDDFPLGIPEDDLIDDDEEIPYNRLHAQVLFTYQIVLYVISHPIFK